MYTETMCETNEQLFGPGMVGQKVKIANFSFRKKRGSERASENTLSLMRQNVIKFGKEADFYPEKRQFFWQNIQGSLSY